MVYFLAQSYKLKRVLASAQYPQVAISKLIYKDRFMQRITRFILFKYKAKRKNPFIEIGVIIGAG
jgi:hypothetical protein